jgi:acetyl-CoA carboxylase biotin carboxyl carrier protein
MTTNEVARLFGKDKPADPASSSSAAEVLKQLQDSALGLLAGLDRAPKSLRIRADQVEIEVEWPEQERVAVPAAAAFVSPDTGATLVHGAPSGSANGSGAGVPGGTDDGSIEYMVAHTVGVFYRAPEPGAKPFVEPGDVIAQGQQIGIIEAMKLMIPVESEVAGRVVEVLVTNGAQVEYGDRLFSLEPVG